MNLSQQVEYIIDITGNHTVQLNKIEKSFEKLNGTVNKTKKSTKSLSNDINALAGLVGVGFALKNFFQLGLELEQNAKKFEILTGSMEDSIALMGELEQMSNATPFGVTELADATTTLLSYGIAQKDIMKDMSMLGDISLGSTDKLKRLTLAFGQVFAKGRLVGAEAKQLVELGFSPLSEISKLTGQSVAELEEQMSKGGISIDLLRKAMQNATGPGGRFYKALEKMQDTGFGRLNQLTNTWRTTLAQVSADFINALKPLLELLVNVVQWVAKNKEMVGLLLSVIVPIAGAVISVVAAFKLWVIVSELLKNSLLKNPIFIIATVLIAIASAAVYAYRHFEPFRQLIDGLAGVFGRLWEILTSFTFDNFADRMKTGFNKVKNYITNFIKESIEPFTKVMALIQEGRYLDAAKQLGKAIIGVTPIGIAARMMSDGVNAVRNSSAFKNGVANGTSVADRNKADAAAALPPDLVDDNSKGAANLSAAAKMQGISINIQNLGINNSTITLANTDDLDLFEKNLKLSLTKVLNDTSRTFI